MEILKRIGHYMHIHKKRVISALIVLIFLLILIASVYYITIDDGTWDDNEAGRPSTYTHNVKFSAEDGKNGVVIDKDGIIKQTLIDMKYTEEQIANFTEQDIIEILDMSKKLNKTVNSLNNCTQAEILWCVSEAYSKYLDKPEELEKLLNAEIITQYPKIGTANADLNGIIEFQRYKTDGTSLMLQYIDIDTFNNYIDEKNTDIVNYFTIDESENVLIGIVDETTEELTSNDSEMILSNYTETLDDTNKVGEGSYSKTEYNVYSKAINYKSAVSKYTMPFQYLWSLIVVGNDKDIALELVDLVEDSEIVISIYDNITTTVDTSTYTYNKERKVNVSATATATTTYGQSASDSDTWSPAAEWQISGNYEIKQIFTYKNNIPVVDLTKADVWIVDYSKEYIYQASQQTSQEVNEKGLDDTAYIGDSGNPITSEGNGSDLPEYDRFKEKLEGLKDSVANEAKNKKTDVLYDDLGIEIPFLTYSSISSVKASYYTHEVNKHRKDISTVSNQKYVAGNVINNPKVDKNSNEPNFVTILCDFSHREARNKITTEIYSWLFELLETNTDTINMVDLTKYLLYKVTDRSYGVKDYDFSVYENFNFSSAGTIYGDTIQEKVWFMLKDLGYSDISAAGAMGNIHYESSGFNPSAVEGGYTETTGGIGICQWTNNNRGDSGRNTNLRNYAISKGTTWQDEAIQVEFLRGELTKGGGADGYASYQLLTTKSYYNSDLACASAWENATTVEDATKAFCYSFERPGKSYAQSSMATRISYAQQYYNMYNGMQAPLEINTVLTGSNKSKMQSMISEAIRIANDDNYKYSQSFRESQYYYDCSSFVSRLYTQYFGISRLDAGTAGRGTDNIRVNAKSKYTQVSLNSLQPGDILWRDGHVALYIGNNQTAEAASTKTGIVVRTMGKYTEAYRIIK